jgi:hypothetical protein
MRPLERPIPSRFRRASLVLASLTLAVGLRLLLPPPVGQTGQTRPAEPPRPSGSAPSEEPVPASIPAAPAGAETRVYLGPGSPLAPELNAPGGSGARDVEIVQQITGALLSSLKGPARPPLGSNADFARALRGENRLGVLMLPARHPAFDGRGELIDRWGTPYHFHAVSSDFIEIRSAGPDLRLFTDDDFVDSRAQKKIRVRRE